MRATPQEQKGGIGSHEVSAKFERIGWGVAPNPEHDLGTDLFLSPRDARLVDLGMVVGAQVKAGPSYFAEASVDPETGETVGWWYREGSRSHFDAWLAHQLPHLIVLHDIDSGTSYWAHITTDSVTFLEKGAKIFVPRDQVVDEANVDRLLEVASSTAAGTSWEGSAWTGAGNLSPSHLYRHALVVPRLIAPHPNQGDPEELTPAQALAMLVLGRLERLARTARGEPVTPELEEIDSDSPWGWQLVAGLHNYLRTGEADAFVPAFTSAQAPHEQAAAGVMLAAAHLEDGHAQQAQDTLGGLLAADQLDLVDHAWVQLQHARALRELGAREQARSEVLGLVNFAVQAPKDATAAAIGGAAANMLFNLSDWGSHDIATTIAATDTTASWWRQQVVSWGLAEQTEKAFLQWARDRSITLGGGDQTWRHLRAASLMAGFLGDHNAWRHAMELLAQYLLLDRDHIANPQTAAAALEMLRVAGAEKSLKLAAQRLVSDGPASAAQKAADGCDPAASTTTSAHADLTFLTKMAELLSPTRADDLARWVLALLADPREYIERVRPTFLVASAGLDLLNALVAALTDDMQEVIADWLLALPPQEDQLTANRLSVLTRRLPEGIWTDQRVRRAAERAEEDNWELKYALLTVAGRALPEVRHRLLEEAGSGSTQALGALGPVTDLDAPLVRELVTAAVGDVHERIAKAQAGMFTGGGHDPAYTLAVLNVWHPEHAHWDALYRLFTEVSYGDYLVDSLAVLAGHADRLHEEVAAQLLPLAERIADRPAEPTLLFGRDARPAACQLVAAVHRRVAGLNVAEVAMLAGGSREERIAAALLCQVAADSVTLGILAVLTRDRDSAVRATAAAVVADRAADDDHPALALLPQLTADPGTDVPFALAAAAARNASPRLFDALSSLATHPSARVRARYAEAPDRSS